MTGHGDDLDARNPSSRLLVPSPGLSGRDSPKSEMGVRGQSTQSRPEHPSGN